MKTSKHISPADFKYFIVQQGCQNAVGIISENEESVSFCNLTLVPYLHALTGKIEFKLEPCPETAIRFSANPTFKNNVQIGITRSMIDLTKDYQEVERVLQFNKKAEGIQVNKITQNQV